MCFIGWVHVCIHLLATCVFIGVICVSHMCVSYVCLICVSRNFSHPTYVTRVFIGVHVCIQLLATCVFIGVLCVFRMCVMYIFTSYVCYACFHRRAM